MMHTVVERLDDGLYAVKSEDVASISCCQMVVLDEEGLRALRSSLDEALELDRSIAVERAKGGLT